MPRGPWELTEAWASPGDLEDLLYLDWTLHVAQTSASKGYDISRVR